MRAFIHKNLNIHTTYLLMVTLTLLSYGLGKFDFTGLGSVFILLLTVLIKGYLIISEFMELRDVSLIWRIIMYGWLWMVCIVIGIIFLFSL